MKQLESRTGPNEAMRSSAERGNVRVIAEQTGCFHSGPSHVRTQGRRKGHADVWNSHEKNDGTSSFDFSGKDISCDLDASN